MIMTGNPWILEGNAPGWHHQPTEFVTTRWKQRTQQPWRWTIEWLQLLWTIAQHVGPPSSQPPSATSQPSASQSSPALSASANGTAYMEYSIYIWSTPFIYGALHLYMEHSICIWSTPFVYAALHLYMEHSICVLQHSIYIWSTPFIYGALHLCM